MIPKFLLILTLILMIPCFPQENHPSGALKVIIKGFANDLGNARLALYNSFHNYESDEQTFRTRVSSISAGTVQAVFDSIPYGEYAVKVFHDENENKNLDTNFLGMPIEAYGFSNNARGSFGPADWDDAKFMFSLPLDSIVIIIE